MNEARHSECVPQLFSLLLLLMGYKIVVVQRNATYIRKGIKYSLRKVHMM